MAGLAGSGELAATPPFDFRHSLEFLRQFTPLQGEQTIEGDSLVKALRVDGRTVAFRVGPAGDSNGPRLRYELFAGQEIEPALREAVLDRISFFLSLDDDLRPFYAIGRDDPHFSSLIDSLHGYHQVKFLTPFENAAWAILSQRSPAALSRKMKAELVRAYGTQIEVGEQTYEAFPEATDLARVDVGELLAVIRNQRRAEYLSAAAAAFSRADEAFLRHGPYDEVHAWLREIKGIGPWSAAFILIRGLGRMERACEVRLEEAAGRVYGGGRPLPSGEVERISARYGEWQGYWAHYLRAAG